MKLPSRQQVNALVQYSYMAPEMFNRAMRGPPEDVHVNSLGCLYMYLKLFGRKRVWPGLDGTKIMIKVCGLYDNAPCMSDLNHLDGIYMYMYSIICTSCCQLDPANRSDTYKIVDMAEQI